MDLRIDASDGAQWLELRKLHLQEGAADYSGQLRVRVAGRVHDRPFWFGRNDLAEFLREAEWLLSSTAGEATLNHVGLPDYFTLTRDALGWVMAGELFHFSDAEQHVRFQFQVPSPAVEALLSAMGALVEQRAPAG